LSYTITCVYVSYDQLGFVNNQSSDAEEHHWGTSLAAD